MEQLQALGCRQRHSAQMEPHPLVRQLHRNRGALRVLYPRNRRRVASFFPPTYSRAAQGPAVDEVAEDAEDVEDAAAS